MPMPIPILIITRRPTASRPLRQNTFFRQFEIRPAPTAVGKHLKGALVHDASGRRRRRLAVLPCILLRPTRTGHVRGSHCCSGYDRCGRYKRLGGAGGRRGWTCLERFGDQALEPAHAQGRHRRAGGAGKDACACVCVCVCVRRTQSERAECSSCVLCEEEEGIHAGCTCAQQRACPRTITDYNGSTTCVCHRSCKGGRRCRVQGAG